VREWCRGRQVAGEYKKKKTAGGKNQNERRKPGAGIRKIQPIRSVRGGA